MKHPKKAQKDKKTPPHTKKRKKKRVEEKEMHQLY